MRAALDAGSSTLMRQSFVEILRAHRDGKCGMDPGMIGRPERPPQRARSSPIGGHHSPVRAHRRSIGTLLALTDRSGRLRCARERRMMGLMSRVAGRQVKESAHIEKTGVPSDRFLKGRESSMRCARFVVC